mmetsp:Transcript_52985/g.151747  ORF Transcript_52985/g.151747 Transcript_52985/m.151747 type:complete len:203 (-) Transcript_52985:335-943(-)
MASRDDADAHSLVTGAWPQAALALRERQAVLPLCGASPTSASSFSMRDCLRRTSTTSASSSSMRNCLRRTSSSAISKCLPLSSISANSFRPATSNRPQRLAAARSRASKSSIRLAANSASSHNTSCTSREGSEGGDGSSSTSCSPCSPLPAPQLRLVAGDSAAPAFAAAEATLAAAAAFEHSSFARARASSASLARSASSLL